MSKEQKAQDEKPPKNTLARRAREWAEEFEKENGEYESCVQCGAPVDPRASYKQGFAEAREMHNVEGRFIRSEDSDELGIAHVPAYNAGAEDYRDQCRYKTLKGRKEEEK